jgi:hypothetical protein
LALQELILEVELMGMHLTFDTLCDHLLRLLFIRVQFGNFLIGE